jgi:hypothetical protein
MKPNASLKQVSAILKMNELAKGAGLPSYTDLETTLTELAMAVKHDKPEDMGKVAKRAIDMLCTESDLSFLAPKAEGLDLSIAQDRAIFRTRVAHMLRGYSVTVMRGWISNPPLARGELVRAIADAYIGG